MAAHGLWDHPLHTIWTSMKQRCMNTNAANYSRYGGRGITVCEEWQEFLPFYEWSIANGYAAKLDLDRIDNDGPYSPDNCRFVTRSANNRNKRTNVMLTAFGETKTMMDWAEDPRCAVPYSTLRTRIAQTELSHEAAISKPAPALVRTAQPIMLVTDFRKAARSRLIKQQQMLKAQLVRIAEELARRDA